MCGEFVDVDFVYLGLLPSIFRIEGEYIAKAA